MLKRMGFDTHLKRYWMGILGSALGIAAYFQAAGIGQLVSGHLVPKDVQSAKAGATIPGSDLPKKDGTIVLSRNPFDSKTGPLNGKPKPSSSALEVADAPRDNGDPYADSPCAGMSASLITAADNPAWSFASISGGDGDKLRRIGDKVGSGTVLHIGYYDSPDHDLTPRVWIKEGATRCIVSMGEAKAVAKAKAPTADKADKASKRAKLEAEVKSKIRKVGENSFVVEKSGVETIIQHYAKLAGSTRAKGTKEGLQLKGIKPDSILGELGLKTGDFLQNINGFDMGDPEKAVDAYAKLRKAGKLDMTFSRDGAPVVIHIQIE